ncbi:MAG: hypothetical protein CME82_15590 [Halomonas sp.]|jgi:hypothetical protein|nr:hypothetical protein [Halomonas sp.]MBU18147.1 hypothetical protein [Chloroflexota bacterium]|tara:strand:+ start:4094 stop:4351 length:258 start_codon:yes stop_codon:yes gene_type:complete
MTELEMRLLQQLEQQQRDSEQLVGGLSEQLRRLQTAVTQQRAENATLRRELAESDRQNAAALTKLAGRVERLTALLNGLGKRSSE